MAASLLVLNEFLSNDKYKAILSVIKGFRNGAVYGAKVRFPHALVNTMLFKSGSLKTGIRGILLATFTHSKNLALFVAVYKSLIVIFKRYSCLQKSKIHLQYFFAAFIGGLLIFGSENKINEQINLYLLSRVVYGLIKLAAMKGFIPKLNRSFGFPLFGAVVWGIAVWLFETHPSVLQPSLQASMTYLYRDSNYWRNVKDFLLSNTS